MQKCLGCYQELPPAIQSTYHAACSKKLFGTDVPPEVTFDADDLEEMAKTSLNRLLGVTGVQPKISVDVEKQHAKPNHRIVVVGLWGNFILKPSTRRFPDLAVVEDLTMHLAKIADINTAQHGLIRLKSGELAYITRRFDRDKKLGKIAVEDFCQLSELLTESKYKTSTEKAGKTVLKYSTNPGLDAIAFFEIILFSYLTGNADMHLKNFSLLRSKDGTVGLSPAYDLLSTKLMPLKDPEELALTVNGKKTKIKRKDFFAMGEKLAIPSKAIENCFSRLEKAMTKTSPIIDASFLSVNLKERYKKLIQERSKVFLAN